MSVVTDAQASTWTAAVSVRFGEFEQAIKVLAGLRHTEVRYKRLACYWN
jgi:hypothetical protein